ncbi:hypothetical protein HG536_0G02150 [Torulaspora globosa]|uniref:2,5-diamino-6-ribosylamino-4(3H)-pyrimidinone 5'-phosphate reductase n=1 Tax=Torulaspora globosa TaxID=48254 RepID=A0A7G3ZLH0_9SACH|nr:uncharacterized protein HG536_0G02150 [Torulaspora globosa]QLL34356.1 hypothetical protein HG536_0G02150 [Torulaspora globosa]
MSLQPLRDDLPRFLEPYLPQPSGSQAAKPFVTLTYAQSLDSRISKGKGIRTTISHAETKTMTHYLRYHHDGILIGSGTVLADDPGLNCKYGSEEGYSHSPRPIVLDSRQQWRFEGSKMKDLYLKSQGQAPIVVVSEEPREREKDVAYLLCPYLSSSRVDWKTLLKKLHDEFDIKSIMVEGGATVINDLLLKPALVDALIITIGSRFLGSSGVEVSPIQSVELEAVAWWNGTADAVLCAKLSGSK